MGQKDRKRVLRIQVIEMEFVKLRIDEGIAVMTIDNPPVNVLSPKVLEELDQAVDEISSDPTARGVVITAAGTNAFCAGADVKTFASIGPQKVPEMIKLGHIIFNKIEQFDRPVIAAINGLALGGGCELALVCDIRVSSDRARFSQPEVTLGLIPGWGGTQRLSRLIGPAKAKEMIFTGQMVTAQKAFRIGLVNKVVPDGEELRAAMDILRIMIAKASPLAVRTAKRAINQGMQKPLAEALEIEIKAIQEIASSEDLKEGIEAFIQKRPAGFQGK
jgi:enoyl-CoA hydratase/carnithine racemase